MNAKHKGKNVGYVRVSSLDQNTDRQLDGVALDKTFEDKASGKDTNRPQLQACLDYLREGDVLHVHSMDRLARSLVDMLRLVSDLTSRGVGVHFHKENLSFTGDDTPSAKLMLQVMGAVAEFERSMIKERQREGIQAYKAKGGTFGPKTRKLTPEQVEEMKARVAQGAEKKALAAEYGISRAFLYKLLG